MEGHGKLVIYSDGASRGNPGPAGVGVVVEDGQGRAVRRLNKFIGHATNNQAEYAALILGIEEARRLGARQVEFRLDSELVVRQMTGVYRVRNVDLQPFYREALSLLKGIERYSLKHIPRSLNQGADILANKAIDGHTLL